MPDSKLKIVSLFAAAANIKFLFLQSIFILLKIYIFTFNILCVEVSFFVQREFFHMHVSSDKAHRHREDMDTLTCKPDVWCIKCLERSKSGQHRQFVQLSL